MPEKKTMMCVECKHWFPINMTIEKMEIIFTFCKKKGNPADFETSSEVFYGIGYIRSLKEFKNVLINATKENLKIFFQNTIKVYSFEENDAKFIFQDAKGNIISLREIHKFIQSDVVMQRTLYNMWMDLYR
ncbi:MAG: hypothetical protein ACTSRD_07975 [Promethearchaeota archaeon]